ncbi:hypothetical protein [Cellulomonas telluris]|uniref:hypothetical protein n=1 Tax=Cellulomonas telluris TaxID=2306636 RepID=UPI0010A76FD1|nr:hypothetical protein [Cellulomonas telluris]
MGEYVEREFFDTLITGDCILGVDASNDVLAEFEESEIATLRRRFRDLSAIVVEHTSEECLRTILHHAVRGLDGVVDDNFGNLFEFSEY